MTHISENQRNTPQAQVKSRYTKPLWILGGTSLALIGSYAAAGYLWLPNMLRNAAQTYVQDKLGQPAYIGDIKVDPFRFTLDISNIAIPAKEPMFQAEHLHIDFAARSIFSDSYRLNAIRAEKPRLQAVFGQDGHLNLLKLMPPPNDDPLPSLLIADLGVNKGVIHIADHSRTGKPSTTLSPISFTLQNLHTTQDAGGRFKLNAVSDQGATFDWVGRAALAPMSSSGTLKIEGLRAERLQRFMGDFGPDFFSNGIINTELTYAIDYKKSGYNAKANIARLAIQDLGISPEPDMLNAAIQVGDIELRDLNLKSVGRAGQTTQNDIHLGQVLLTNIQAIGTGPAKGHDVKLASADLQNLSFAGATPTIGQLVLSGLDSKVVHEGQGRINLMRFLPVAPKTSAQKPAQNTQQGSMLPDIQSIELRDSKLYLVDLKAPTAAIWTVSPLSIKASGNLAANEPLRFVASTRLNGRTSISANGHFTPSDTSVDAGIKVSNLPLTPVVKYAVDFPRLKLVSGQASVDGRIKASPAAQSFAGNATVDNLRLIETYQNSNLVGWRKLEARNIQASAKSASIQTVNLYQPSGTLTIFPDGTLNMQRLVTFNPRPVVPPSPAVTQLPPPKLTRAEKRALERELALEAEAAKVQALADLAAPIVPPSYPVKLANLQIHNGELDFGDYSLAPNFAIKIQNINGSIQNISNHTTTKSVVDLNGYVIDKYAPVTIKGHSTLLQYDRSTDINMAFRNIELPVLNPYSGRWAGYSIARGKLSTELGYKIENRKLQATHHVLVDQLVWGKSTDSQEKVSMPIRLATMLLKDKDGKIELDMPVNGTLDDPEFRIAPLVWKIIGNVMTKAITAPFRALGGLFGDKEDVQYISFAPGSIEIPPQAKENLASIAKGLAERPELKLDIPAGPGLPLDSDFLAEQRIRLAATQKEQVKGRIAAFNALSIEEQHNRLEKLFKNRLKIKPEFPPKQNGESKADRTKRELDFMKRELVKAFASSPQELAELGKQRANNVRLALLESGHDIAPERIFLSTRDSATIKNGTATMELKLELN